MLQHHLSIFITILCIRINNADESSFAVENLVFSEIDGNIETISKTQAAELSNALNIAKFARYYHEFQSKNEYLIDYLETVIKGSIKSDQETIEMMRAMDRHHIYFTELKTNVESVGNDQKDQTNTKFSIFGVQFDATINKIILFCVLSVLCCLILLQISLLFSKMFTLLKHRWSY